MWKIISGTSFFIPWTRGLGKRQGLTPRFLCGRSAAELERLAASEHMT